MRPFKKLLRCSQKIRFTAMLILTLSILTNIFQGARTVQGQSQTVDVKIRVSSVKTGEVDPKIYGHFIEHLGRCIYGGVWVGENSQIPNLRGFRLDVLEAVKAIAPPVIRWPGGCFADGYHWKDGIGPRDKRLKRTNPAWGGIETNQFGTDEFIDFCREVGAEPFIVVNVGSGTPQEAAEWVEYCNGNANTTYGRLRSENGHSPYNVKYWGLGNELYGEWEIGHMDAAQYAQAVVNFARAMKSVDPSIKLVAVGQFGTSGESASWNRKVLEFAGEYIDYLSLHTYCWKPPKDAYYTIVNYPLNVERDLKGIVRQIDSIMKDKGKKIEISLDEWGVWYADATSQLMQDVRLCDGLLAAGMFHVFHRLSKDVTIATFAQLVNVLPAIVTNDRGAMYLTPIYLAFKLYRNNTGKIVLSTSVTGTSNYYLDVLATMNEDASHLYLAVINKYQTNTVNASISLEDFDPKQVCKAYQLNGPSWDSKNDFKSPNTVKITSSYVTLNITEGSFTYAFEPHSVTIIVLENKNLTSIPTATPTDTQVVSTTPEASVEPAYQQTLIIILGVVATLIVMIILILLKRLGKNKPRSQR
ncbi:MAG: alpha-N-arabinofuranosidase [Thermoproteota archaeon]